MHILGNHAGRMMGRRGEVSWGDEWLFYIFPLTLALSVRRKQNKTNNDVIKQQ